MLSESRPSVYSIFGLISTAHGSANVSQESGHHPLLWNAKIYRRSQRKKRIFVSLLYCSGKKAGDQRPPNLNITPTPHARSCFNIDGLQNSQRTVVIALSAKWLSFSVEQLAFDSRMGKAFPTRQYGYSDNRLLCSPSRIGRPFLGINTLERNKRI